MQAMFDINNYLCPSISDETFEEAELKKRNPNIISDHALVRYLDRVKGVDVDKMKQEMSTDILKSSVNQGATSVRIDGFTYVIRNKIVTTVY